MRQNRSRRRIPQWHAQFLAMLPAIVTHAKLSFRHLRAEARAEAVQEVVCNALKAFVRLIQLKKTDVAYPTVLARYGVAQVRDHRQVGARLNIKDVMSKYCQDRKGIIVERLDHYSPVDDEWTQMMVEDRRAGPAETARIRLDFGAWLDSLKSRDRKIATFLANGESTTAAAKKFNVSAGRISQLRRELAENWRRFVGDDASTAAVPA